MSLRVRVSLDVDVNPAAWGQQLTTADLAAAVRSYVLARVAESDAVYDLRIRSVAPAGAPRIHVDHETYAH